MNKSSSTTVRACTSSVTPKAPRGGKGADKRFAAYDAACARLAALYCGASSYSIAGMSIGYGRASSHTAAVSVWQGSRCRDGAAMHVPQRFVPDGERAAAVNACG